MAIPGSDIYGWRKNDALNAWNTAKLRIGRKRQDVLSSYGYTADYDAAGNMTNMRVDPTSQYGKFQQMMKSHATTLDQVQQNQIDRGLGAGTAGLGAQQESEARYVQGGEQADLGRELSGTITDLSEAEQDAAREYNTSIANIDAEAARAAWEDEQFTKALTPDEIEAAQEEGIPLAQAARAKATGKTVKVGPKGKAMNAQQLARHITSTGGSVSKWAKQHPAAAKRIGLKVPAPKKKGKR